MLIRVLRRASEIFGQFLDDLIVSVFDQYYCYPKYTM